MLHGSSGEGNSPCRGWRKQPAGETLGEGDSPVGVLNGQWFSRALNGALRKGAGAAHLAQGACASRAHADWLEEKSWKFKGRMPRRA